MNKVIEITPEDYSDINAMLSFTSYKLNNANPFIQGYKIRQDNQLVGFISYSLIYDRIELEYIYIKEQYRHQHLASLLMDKMLEEKYTNITLEVNEQNEGAISLYKKYGFKEITKRSNYYQKDDAIVMERKS